MDFNLTEEQKMLRQTMSRFIENECPKEKIRELDESDRFPSEIFSKLADLGVLGLTTPVEYAGTGRDLFSAITVLEMLSSRFPALGWAFVQAAFYGGETISKLGSKAQKERYLPEIASGKRLFSYALTEPNAGSDAAAAATFAAPAGDDFVINGTKTFITGADVAGTLNILVRTDKNVDKRKGLSMFLIDCPVEGLTIRHIKKLGYKCSSFCEVVIEDVTVAKENILGGPEMLNQGWPQLLSTLDVEHLEVAACALGVAEGAYQEALQYAQERTQFGRSIGKFQGVSHQLADLATDIAASRMLLYHACWVLEEGRPAPLESTQAKLFSAETARKAGIAAMQILGGYGYCMEFDAQRFLRDSLALVIGGGTPEILKNVIARKIGL
ncbi:MAG: acyl-CoA dehydrogenase family protein [Deltaproteobacteria bacterium]|nr:acyl-CoA dehydrogenase family protein [Deltaproteobacteria bacterium]